MKIGGTLLLSLLLLVTQWAAARPVGAGTVTRGQVHSCCPPAEAIHCTAQCCFTAGSPAAPSQPAPAPPTSVRLALDMAAWQTPLWTLPDPGASAAPLHNSGSPITSLPGLPLFLRHATLLI